MKFSAATLFAAGASAAAIGKRSIFEVSDFSAACIQHSVQCVYEFGVFEPGSWQKEPQQCRTQVLGLANGDLPEVGPWQGKCELTSKTFSVVRTDDGGLTLTVSRPVSPISNTTAVYTIPAADFEHQQSGASIREVYIGPTSFNLEFQ